MNLQAMDARLLTTLDVLLEERGVTRAANRLGLSQPAVSTQLAKLRRLFDDPLLVGNAHGMSLTRRAIELQAPLHQALMDLQAVVRSQPAFDPATASRVFTIVGSDYAIETIIVPLIAGFYGKAPNVRISALAVKPESTLIEMENGTIDICIAARDWTHPDFPARKLLHERFVFIINKDHPDADKELTLDQFCSMEFVLPSPSGGGFEGVIDTSLEKLGKQRKVVATFGSFLLVINMVKSSKYVAVVPERLVLANPGRLKIVELPFDMSGFDLFQSWHARSKTDKGHIWLREAILYHARRMS
ncbi:MAG: LysR family transcriptional regulator [Hyphomicrobiales bacterium]|nr:LysR family transcriptional regulator [Hyphomicrobiales bacterium]